VSGLLQSLFVAACLGLTPAIKLVPTACLWGYFLFMACESLPGSQVRPGLRCAGGLVRPFQGCLLACSLQCWLLAVNLALL